MKTITTSTASHQYQPGDTVDVTVLAPSWRHIWHRLCFAWEFKTLAATATRRFRVTQISSTEMKLQ